MTDWADEMAVELVRTREFDFEGERDDQSPVRALAELAAALRIAYEKGRQDCVESQDLPE